MNFIERSRNALLALDSSFSDFLDAVRRKTPSRETPKGDLDRLADLASEGKTRVAALLHSLWLVEETGLDVVDMESRLRGESGDLADVLADIGRAVSGQFFLRRDFGDALNHLDESAQSAAAALYPSPVQGLNRANLKILEFSRLLMVRYRLLRDRLIQQEDLSRTGANRVEAAFQRIERQFSEVNEFLNVLASERLNRGEVRKQAANARKSLREARRTASASRSIGAFKDFKSILKEIEDCARDVDGFLKGLRIPVFPSHGDLEDLLPCIEESAYGGLAGLEAFALLNIASRMRHTVLGEDNRNLLSPEFDVRVMRAFPDRVYLDVHASLIERVRMCDQFGVAPAALHKYRDGSFKQKVFREGNLQVSYQMNGDRCYVDADIDLYRDPLLHLFGEVLVNGLTGGKTDQYRVMGILKEQGVAPIGGFQIISI